MAKSFTFIETDVFTKRIVKLVDDETYADLQAELVKEPTRGQVIQGTGGLRKIRMAARGKGKRGGVRVIYFHLTDDEIVLLVMVYAKAVQANVKPKDIKRG